jgi:cysteine synthase A
LARNYGLLVGSSSGAVMAAAVKESLELPTGSSIATVFPDGGDRYLSKKIYAGQSAITPFIGGTNNAF